jgi:RimJ/RimL family protein N-acetyltransferase
MTQEPVRLRGIRNDDSESLYGWLNEPRLARLSAPYRPVHEPSHEAWLRALADDRSKVAFAIEETETGGLVGMVQLVDIHGIHRNAEMRIRIGESGARGRGLGAASLRLLLDHAWRDLGLHRVYAYVFADNERAIASYASVGFEQEGRLRDAAYIDGAWSDVLVVAVLAPCSGTLREELTDPLLEVEQ